MARNSVRTDVGQEGQGEWVDQSGSTDGSAHVKDQRDPGHRWSDGESLTVSTTALALTAANYAGHNSAFIDVQAEAIRYRLDGVAPSTTVGHIAASASTILLENVHEIAGFRVIRDDASDAPLFISYGNRL